jgi:hypothetical protein
LTHPLPLGAGQLRVASLDDGAADHVAADADVLFGAGAANGGVRVVLPSVCAPIGEYMASRGLDANTVESRVEQYGRNILSIPSPSFFAMYV